MAPKIAGSKKTGHDFLAVLIHYIHLILAAQSPYRTQSPATGDSGPEQIPEHDQERQIETGNL